MEKYKKLKKADLVELAAGRALKQTGTKQQLASRIYEYDRRLKFTRSSSFYGNEKNNIPKKMPKSKSTTLIDKTAETKVKHRPNKQIKEEKENHSNNKNNEMQQNHQHNQHYHLTKLDKDEMSKYVLWRKPIQTLYYFILELFATLFYYLKESLNYKKTLFSLFLFILTITIGFQLEGQHLPYLLYVRKQLLWYLYWIGLGIASSIGFGSGLHTFLLYLGPFIAKVTLAAYECNTVNFPEPPFPDVIMCPNETDSSNLTKVASITLWSIMSKVRLESFMWGFGTAIGELPPYFMARASALSSSDKKKPDDLKVEELNSDEEELEELEELMKNDPKNLSFVQRVRLFVFKIINKVGFFGILLCASIPNPLFDLAGITCGHFLVKFSTFFGATLIGKAIIKMHIQKLFVILVFSEHHIENLVQKLGLVPFIGKKLQPIFIEFLNNEKRKLHSAGNGSNVGSASNASLLSWIFEKLVLCFILFFVISIINSLAQKHYKRKLIQKSKPSSD